MATKGLPTHMPLPHYTQKASSNFLTPPKPRLTPRSPKKKRKRVSQVRSLQSSDHMSKSQFIPQVPAVATAMPSPRGDRPVRSVKQVRRAPGYVDSSTLLFDSEDEGPDDMKSESEHDSEDEGTDESDDGARHIAKKPRLGQKHMAQPKEVTPPPPPDSSCLVYYPELYDAIQRWNRSLGLPPPLAMSDASGDKIRKREIDTPEPQVAKALLPQDVEAQYFGNPDFKIFKDLLPDGFRIVRNRSTINRNESYDAMKPSFEKLPGELRNKIYALVFKNKAPIDFMNRKGFAHSAAFLRVNKAIYNEARVFLYSKNHFLFGHNFSKLGAYYEPVWKELGWSHIRRFFTDIGPENTSLIQKVGIWFCDATPSGNPDTNMNQRRYTYNEDLLWILNHLSEHGRILKLKLSFGGRRGVVMSTRDKDFLIALKGVKTDRLDIGNPNPLSNCRNDWVNHSRLDSTVKELIKVVMVRPVPLKELDARLEF